MPVTQTILVRVGKIEVLAETTPVAGSQQTSVTERATAYAMSAFERAQATIEEIAVSTAAMIGRVGSRAARPDQVQVEFGLKVSAKGDVIVAGSSAEASMRVTVTYDAGGPAGTGPVR